MGAFMLVRGTALGQAGLFDERFFMYGEDLDLAYRIKARGWQVFYNPAVTVLHIKGRQQPQAQHAVDPRVLSRDACLLCETLRGSVQWLINIVVRLGITLRGALALALNATRPAEQKRVS